MMRSIAFSLCPFILQKASKSRQTRRFTVFSACFPVPDLSSVDGIYRTSKRPSLQQTWRKIAVSLENKAEIHYIVDDESWSLQEEKTLEFRQKQKGIWDKNVEEASKASSTSATTNVPIYEDPSYWDDRYMFADEPFDWYEKYSGLAPLLQKYIAKSARILMVGCGNAAISADMVKDGYEEIINTDVSSVVIESMQEKYQNISELKYITMDARDMGAFGDSSFDSVIDKGLLDALMSGDRTEKNAEEVLSEVYRVLKPGGTFVLVTHDGPCSRMPYLKPPKFNWTVSLHVIREEGEGCKRSNIYLEPVDISEYEALEEDLALEGLDNNYVFVCIKGPSPP